MRVVVDAQLPPSVATWIQECWRIESTHVRDLGWDRETDLSIFQALRVAGQVVMTKDADFADLVVRLGAPPQVVWLRHGNATSEATRNLLARAGGQVLALLKSGEPLIEVSELRPPP